MSSEMFLPENFFVADQFFPFTDSTAIATHFHLPSEVFPEVHEYQATDSMIPENESRNPVDEANLLNEIASVFLSSPPPSFKLENLSLTQLRNEGRDSVLGGVKTEECGLKIDNAFLPQNIDESAVKFMQRSYSSNSFVNNGQNSSFRARFDSVMETDQNLQNQMLSPPESSIFASSQMRRVCSTGDLQNVKTNYMPKTNVLSSSPSLMEEANFKIGRYSAEERKERIHRYKAKKTQRNFNKTIKYACRKTLADNRLRIRGRFARNDEIPMFHHRNEDEDCFWVARTTEKTTKLKSNELASRIVLGPTMLQTQHENYNHRLITSCREQMPTSVQFK